MAEFEKLAYEAALRSFDKQESYLEELRARTGILLAASSIGASFLGQQAFQEPNPPGLVVAALMAFVVSIGANVFILLPKQDLVFASKSATLYEQFFSVRDNLSEVYRRLTYDLGRFRKSNEAKVRRLRQAFTIAAVALVVEILAFAVLLGGNILSS
ncbi:MAG TPA: hypothetical protein VF030_09175 [Solirubrobacterales bacterium]